ncbi:MAG: dihydrolipoyl dehydrogenase [Anaerolineae bacterium]
MAEVYDIAILGAGPGGYVAALRAAQLGMRVALVEKARVGGTCLNIGCIPTKALVTATELLSRARRAAEYGIRIPQAVPDLEGMMVYQRAAVERLVGGVEQLLKERRVTVVQGQGRLLRPDALAVTDATGQTQEVTARHIILAPGSIPARPPIPGLDLPGVVTSTEALDVSTLPTHLIIIGGGVIGLEFACIYEALGSRVTVLEMMPTLLPGAADDAIAKRLAVILRRRGMDIRTGATVRAVEAGETGLRVRFEAAGKEEAVEGDRVLLATGRWPNTADLGLEEVGVRMNRRAIAVDEYLRTNVPNIWAIGDAVGGMMLAHKAMVDGRVAVENIAGETRAVDYRSVPSAIFTSPEVAGVGLTEAQARQQGADVRVLQFPFSANPRAQILGETEGLVRIVCEAERGRVLGVHLMGPHVTELIAEGALAVQTGATADDLAWTTHAHPTLTEAMLEAALGFRGATIHYHRKSGG